jgi:Ner family transcriptional regulator
MKRSKTAKPRKWHREQIKAEVRMRGETLTSLAVKNELAEDACRDALRTRRPDAEAVIAKFIEVPASELWPDRYPRNEASTDVDTRKRELTHRLNAGAR